MSRGSCPTCGTPSGSGLRFCTECGRRLDDELGSDREHGRFRPGWITVAAVAIGVAVAGGVIVGLTVGRTDGTTGGTGTAQAAPTTVIDNASSGPAVVPQSAPALVDADQVVAQDDATVASLDGSWVPQISSKAVGTVADGVTYGRADILADHQRWRAAYPQAVVFKSERFATFRQPGYWVTVIARPSATPAAANAWCDAAGLPRDGCFAKRLSTVAGGGPTVVTR